VVNPVGSISALLLDLVQKLPIVTVHWNKRVVDVGQDESTAWVDAVDSSGSRSRWEADYVIGCEGAQSAVRKSLFNGRFPGYTWPSQLIAVNVDLPFPVDSWQRHTDMLSSSFMMVLIRQIGPMHNG
jgi:2-polyprenyl-6-methoxyphenol hydroxylase-like FAD-dependent oxidoreductase